MTAHALYLHTGRPFGEHRRGADWKAKSDSGRWTADTRLFGSCDLQIEGLEGGVPCPIIFEPKGSLFLLGATALENFGVQADPVQKTLKPVLAVIGGFLASATK